MPDRILVPFDDSEPAREALEYSFELFPDGDVTALTIVDLSDMEYLPDSPTEPADADADDGVFATAREKLQTATEIADERGVEIETVTEAGPPARTIVDYADEDDVDHIVMGSHGREGLSRILLGSVAETVVRQSSVPVTVVR